MAGRWIRHASGVYPTDRSRRVTRASLLRPARRSARPAKELLACAAPGTVTSSAGCGSCRRARTGRVGVSACRRVGASSACMPPASGRVNHDQSSMLVGVAIVVGAQVERVQHHRHASSLWPMVVCPIVKLDIGIATSNPAPCTAVLTQAVTNPPIAALGPEPPPA